MRNAGLKFVCRPVGIDGRGDADRLHPQIRQRPARASFPVAHGEGNYFADDETLDRLEGEGRVVFRYAPGDNPNGSARDIAGILNEKRNVLGLMPHPERVVRSAARRHRRPRPVRKPDRSAVMTKITPQIDPRARPLGRGICPHQDAARPRAQSGRAGRLLGDVERALLLQIHPRPSEEAADQGALGDPGPGRERRRGRHRRRRRLRLQDGEPQPSLASSSPTRARRPASAASCATSSPWARARSRC